MSNRMDAGLLTEDAGCVREDDSQVLIGIFSRLRTGVLWSYIRAPYRSTTTCVSRIVRWCQQGSGCTFRAGFHRRLCAISSSTKLASI